MGALALAFNKLNSGLIRERATKGFDGFRTIVGPLAKQSEDGGGGILEKVANFGKGITKQLVSLGGSLLKAIGAGFQWSWTALVSITLSAVNFVWNFNWNVTDDELDKYWSSFVDNMAGLAGGAIGNTLGWLACGIVPSLVVMKFNKNMGVRMLKEAGEEALDELCSNVWNLANQAFQGLAKQGAIWLFKNLRRTAKALAGDPTGPFAKGVTAVFGGAALNNIKQWGEKGSKPWSFAIAVEEWVESIGPQWLQNFTEELIEEFQDSCTEAFYVIAGAADQYAIEQKLQREGMHGGDEVIEIYPNRENEEEKIVLAGPQELLKPVIVNTITQYQMLEDRNIGNFMGETIETVANREVRTLMARLIFSSNEKKKKDVTSVTLYNVDKAKLDWLELKEAMGGVNGYMWGPWSVQAKMDDDNVIRVWAATEEEGWDRVQALSKFVEGEILMVNSYHEMKEGKRKVYDSLYKKARKQYPWELLIINPIQILNEENGKATKKGIYKDREALIPLWTADKPDDWAQKLQDLFATPGPDDL